MSWSRWPLGSESWCASCTRKSRRSTPRDCGDSNCCRQKWCSHKEAASNDEPCVTSYIWLLCMAVVLISLLLATMYYRMRDGKRRPHARYRPQNMPRVCVRNDERNCDPNPVRHIPQKPSEPPSEPSPPKYIPCRCYEDDSQPAILKDDWAESKTRNPPQIDIPKTIREEKESSGAEGGRSSPQSPRKRSNSPQRKTEAKKVGQKKKTPEPQTPWTPKEKYQSGRLHQRNV